MTPNEKNKAIAEKLGWIELERSGITLADPPYFGYPPTGAIIGKKQRVSDFCNDLNACLKMVEFLTIRGWNFALAKMGDKWDAGFWKDHVQQFEAKNESAPMAVCDVFLETCQAENSLL